MNEQLDAAGAASIAVDPVTQLILSLSLAFTMLTVALSLQPQDFRFVKAHPTAIITGFFAQVIALPILTLLLIKLVGISAGLAMGMIIVACCPGGAMSNLITQISGGDAAYSVSLTMVSSVFSALMLPLAILFWVGFHEPANELINNINIDREAFIKNTTTILVIPLAIGLLIAWRKPVLADRLRRYFMPVSLLILIGLIIVGTYDNFEMVREHGARIFPLVILHNGLAFVTGGLIGRAFLPDRKKARALTFEVGIQNAGLGLIIVMAELGGFGDAALMVGTWGLWHLVAGFGLANLLRIYAPLRSK